MSVPILISSGKIEEGREMLMHASIKSSLHKSEEDELMQKEAKQSKHKIVKGKGGEGGKGGKGRKGGKSNAGNRKGIPTAGKGEYGQESSVQGNH